MRRDVIAGVLLVNALPHLTTAAAGRRCLTPLAGPRSGPLANAAWAALNLAGAAALVFRPAAGSDVEWTTRRRHMQRGVAAMAVLGLVYETVAAHRGRTVG